MVKPECIYDRLAEEWEVGKDKEYKLSVVNWGNSRRVLLSSG